MFKLNVLLEYNNLYVKMFKISPKCLEFSHYTVNYFSIITAPLINNYTLFNDEKYGKFLFSLCC